jgi:signal transduction histidine kinase
MKKTRREIRGYPDEEILSGVEGPEGPDARHWFRVGNAHLHAGELAHAVAAYEQALRQDPNCAAAHHNLGVTWYKQGIFARAEACLRRALELDPERAESHYLLGLVLQDRRDWAGAIACFDQALRRQPGYLRARYSRALALFEAGRTDEAVADFEAVAEADPTHLDAIYNAAVAHAALNNWPRAEEWFSRCVALEPDNAELHYRLGLAYAQQPDPLDQRAIAALEEALRLDPLHAEARFRLGLLYARRKREDPAARSIALFHLRSLTEMDDLPDLFPDVHRAYFALASLCDDDPAGWPEAEELYRRCLALRADFAPAHNNLGVLYEQQGRHEEALQEFREAVLADPDYERAYHNLGKVYFQREADRLEEEIEWFLTEAPEQSPRILRRLLITLMDLARQEVYSSFYNQVHKVKNLLGVTGAKSRSLLRQLEEGKGPPELCQRVDELNRLQQRAYEEMAGYLKVSPGADLRFEPVDLNELVRRVLRQTRREPAQGGSYQVETVLDPALPRLAADGRRLRELLTNLILNGYEAMPQGGTLTVETRQARVRCSGALDDQQEVVVLTVRDTGSGLPPEELRRILMPGFTTKPQGSGMGLAIVQQVVREHGGRLDFQSEVGKGSTVRVEFPTHPAPDVASGRMRLRPVIFEDMRELMTEEVS